MPTVHMKKVDLPNGETIAYREREGGKEVVILVHGNMTSSVHWDLIMEKLDPEFKIYALDQRGFGQSTYRNKIKRIKDFSDDLKLFADQLRLTDFILVGWSLGGTVCQQFCAEYPGLAKKLFLLASGSSRGYPYYATGENGLPNLSRRLETYEDIAEDGKTKIIQAAYDSCDYSVLRQIWEALIYTNRKPEPERYQKYLEEMAAQRNLAETYHVLNRFNISPVHNGLVPGEDKIKHIQIPVLIAWGEHDLVVTKEMTEELIEDFGTRAENIMLKGCGHSPMTDDPEQLIGLMEGFSKK